MELTALCETDGFVWNCLLCVEVTDIGVKRSGLCMEVTCVEVRGTHFQIIPITWISQISEFFGLAKNEKCRS